MLSSLDPFDIEFENELIRECGLEKFNPKKLEAGGRYLRRLAKEMPTDCKVVTIAGTNGKGQTCHFINELLRLNHVTFLSWSSPHVVSIRERFQSNTGMISVRELSQYRKAVKDDIQRSNIQLSFYEFLLACFFKWVMEKGPEYLILEVGLGGRLDAVNYLDAHLVGLTSIGRDHQEFLGQTYREILKEKWGVTRKKKRAYSCLNLDYLIQLCQQWSQAQGVHFIDLNKDLGEGLDFESRNFMLAKNIVGDLLGGNADLSRDLTPSKGRWEQAQFGQLSLTFCGSHNLAGIREVAKKVSKLDKAYDFVLCTFSQRSWVDLRIMARIIQRLGTKIFLTAENRPKMINLEQARDLSQEFRKINTVQLVENWRECLLNLKGTQLNGLVIGSYYFVGAVQRYLIKSSL